VSDTKAVSDLDLSSIIASNSQQSSDDTLLVKVASEGVVQDGEERLSTPLLCRTTR
jgi:hypothetical protein